MCKSLSVRAYAAVALLVTLVCSRAKAQDLALDSLREQRIQSCVTRICQDAWERFRQGQYRRAQTGFRKAGLYRPRDWSLKLDLAHALLGEGDYDYAAYAIRRALDLHPEPLGLHYDLRDVFRTDDRFEETREQLGRFVEEHPLNRDGLFCWGYFLLFTDQEEEARGAFEQVLALDPQDRYARLFGERVAVRDFHSSRVAPEASRAWGPTGPILSDRISPDSRASARPGPAEHYRRALTQGSRTESSDASVSDTEALDHAMNADGPDGPGDGLDDLEARRPLATEPLPAQGQRAGVLPPREAALPGRPRLTDR